MAIQQPISTDFLNSPDHSLSHRVFANDGSAPVQSVVVSSAGNVGIGTTSPGKKFVVQGAARTFSVDDYIDSAYGPQITSSNDALVLPNTIWFGNSTMKLQKTGSGLILQGDNGYTMNYWNGSAYVTGFKIDKTAGQAQALAPNGFYVSGNVGIGTTSPIGMLQINGSSTTPREMIILSNTYNATPDYSSIYSGMLDSKTSGFMGASSNGSGGLQFAGFVKSGAESVMPLAFSAYQAADPTGATILFRGAKSDGGTSATAIGATAPLVKFRNWGTDVMTILGNGNVGIATTAPTVKLDVNSDIIRLRTAKTPATAGATGDVGSICWDADFIYICVATNTWKKAAIATWA